MNCVYCKKGIPEDSIFCCYCGRKQKSTPKNAKQRGNGQGSVYKLPNGKWRAAVTVSYDSDGKRKVITKQFNTKKEAVNGIPFLLESKEDNWNDITFEQCFIEMMKVHEPTITKSTATSYYARVKVFDPIKHMKLKDIKLHHLQKCIDDSKYKASYKLGAKSTALIVYDYAIKNDIIEKNIAKYIEPGKYDAEPFEPFTIDEIRKIKEAADNGVWFADYIMIMIMTGMRPNEFMSLTKDNYFDGCFHGGSKTEAGKNRVIPVSEIIKPYVDKAMQNDSNYLFPNRINGKWDGRNFRKWFAKTLADIGVQQKPPYSCRHTFATLMRDIDGSTGDITKQKLLGHACSSTNVTKRYTHTDVDALRNVVDQIKI